MQIKQSVVVTGVTECEVMVENPKRFACLIVNDSDTNIYVHIGKDPAQLNQGIRLNSSGGCLELNALSPCTDMIRAISSAANKNLLVVEWSS